MQTTVTNGEITTVFDVAEFNVNVGESAKIDVNEAVNYIKSGQAEVQETVDEGITDFNQNASEKTSDFNSNATEKTGDFNANATDKTEAFNDNYVEKKAVIDAQVGIVETAAQTATTKAGEASQSATSASNSATSAETYAGQAESSASDASDSASTATTQAGIATTKASEAVTSATTATNQANLAKQYAIGEPTEPTEHSAKYWAEQAESELSSKQDLLTSANAGTGISITGSGPNVVISNTQTSAEWGNITGTLSNQTDLNNALNAKQDTISDLSTIRSGAALGATAVQPSSLATVATSGDYDDLSNKPTVDQSYDGTSTNAQSGVAVAQALAGISIPTPVYDSMNERITW